MSMKTTLNWPRLYASGRCKDIGVPWTEEENLAVTKLGIPAEYVRLGILTKAEYLAKKDEIDKARDPLFKKDKEELLKLAHEKDIPATSDASRETLIRLLGGDKAPKASAVKKAEKELQKEEAKKEEEVEKPAESTEVKEPKEVKEEPKKAKSEKESVKKSNKKGG